MKKSLKVVTIILAVIMVLSITSTAFAYTKVDFNGTVADNYFTNTTAKRDKAHTHFWVSFRQHYLTSSGKTVAFTTRAYKSGSTTVQLSGVAKVWDSLPYPGDPNIQDAEFNDKNVSQTIRMKVDNTYHRGSAIKIVGSWGTGIPVLSYPWG